MQLVYVPEKAKEHFKSNVDKILDTGALSEGYWNDALAEDWKTTFKLDYKPTICSSNGTGIVACLNILKEVHGCNKVIMNSNTMFGVKTMIQSANYTIVGYVDSGSLFSPNISYKTLCDAINKLEMQGFDINNLVFVWSHIGGHITKDYKNIVHYCKQRNIKIIEDCAHTVGSSISQQPDKNHLSEFKVYSFYSTKSILGGEGGVIEFGNEYYKELMHRYVIYDRFQKEMKSGVNIRISELSALFIYSVFQCMPEIINNKHVIMRKYSSAFEQNKNLSKNISIDDCVICDDDITVSVSNGYKYIVGCDLNTSTFNQFRADIHKEAELKELPLFTTPVYDYNLTEPEKATGFNYRHFARHHLCLPTWYNQSDDITDRVCKVINDYK